MTFKVLELVKIIM